MDISSFIKSKEYLELKAFLIEEFIDKPMKIKTDGKTAETIALEVMASNISAKKFAQALRKFERKAGVKIEQEQSFR